jgi:hypothetical protein
MESTVAKTPCPAHGFIVTTHTIACAKAHFSIHRALPWATIHTIHDDSIMARWLLVCKLGVKSELLVDVVFASKLEFEVASTSPPIT